MRKLSKKKCLEQGGTWRNGRCSLKRSSVTHKWTKKNPKPTQITLEGHKIKEKKDTITQKTLTGETIEQKKRKKKQRKGKTEKTEPEALFEKVAKEGRWEVWGGKQGTLYCDELGLKTQRKQIPIDEIELKEKYPVNVEMRSDEMAKFMKKGGTLPPILVFGKRYETDTYQVFDGHGRILAHKKSGRKTIDAEITLVDENGQPIKCD